MVKTDDKSGFLFVHTLKPSIGGMEVHQQYFIDHFFNESYSGKVAFKGIVERNDDTYTILFWKNHILTSIVESLSFSKLIQILTEYDKKQLVLFFNDAWWIDKLSFLRERFLNSYMIMRIGGNDIEYAPWKMKYKDYSFRRVLWRNSLNLLNFIIANSDYTIQRLKNLGITNQKIIKIRGGVDTDITNHLISQKKHIGHIVRTDLQIQQKYIISFASRFVPFKGIKEALIAFYESDIQKDSHLLFMGDGVLAKEIYSLASRYLDKNQFTFLGNVSNSDVLRYLTASSLTVNASLEYKKKSGNSYYIHTETMGRTMIESICVRTPLLATNVGGTKELFDENEYIGVLVDSQKESLRNGFNTLPSIIQIDVVVNMDYGWSNVFTQYEKLFD